MGRSAVQFGNARLALSAGSVVVALSAAGFAAAQAPDEAIWLQYRATPGCPDERAFVGRVQARAGGALRLDPNALRTVSVDLRGGAHPSGSVVVEGGGAEGTRRLDAETCDAAADAIALMVALALAPAATNAADGRDAGPADASPPVGASSAAAPPPARSAPAARPPPRASKPAPPSPLRHVFGGADFVTAQGVAPNEIYAGAPFVGWRSTRPATLGWSLRGSFLRAETGDIAATEGGADFTWTLGRLEGCAVLWPARSLRLAACARFEAGVLDVAGKGVMPSETQHSGWIAVDPLGRVEWSFFGPLFLEAAGGPSFHISANRFFFHPNVTVYEVPYVGAFGEAGLGVHFL